MSEAEIDIDMTQSRPLRLGIELHDQVLWDCDDAALRIRGVDLSAVARKSWRLRRSHPEVDVVVDIDVVIAAEARTARALVDAEAHESGEATMLYVGTPSGLASLVTDIHALGLVDGAYFIPRATGVADLIREAVLPVLNTSLRLPESSPQGRPA